MASITFLENAREITNAAASRLFLRGAEETFGDFRDDLKRDGYAVIKGAVPKDRADKYAEQMIQWLEDL
jgi:hypothetical protein